MSEQPYGPVGFSPHVRGLRAIARIFHQDFSLEQVSFRTAITVQAAHMDAVEREELRQELQAALTAYPDLTSFAKHFVSLGASAWPSDDVRAELAEFLTTL
ncbi:MAG TPA: hypothetical protein VF495_21725 [Phenylobacterium sp.]